MASTLMRAPKNRQNKNTLCLYVPSKIGIFPIFNDFYVCTNCELPSVNLIISLRERCLNVAITCILTSQKGTCRRNPPEVYSVLEPVYHQIRTQENKSDYLKDLPSV